MRYFELVLLRLVLWIGLPMLLAVLAVGPRRFMKGLKRGWAWLWRRRLDPEEVLTRVVQDHERHVDALRDVVARSEAAVREIAENIGQSEKNVAALEAEAGKSAAGGDDLDARAVLYKLNLERAAIDSFRAQLERQKAHTAEARRNLYLMELRLRQYEVGRSILLSQLAEAKTVEQQAAIAEKFDPFNAVANWEKAEGVVEKQSLQAKASQRVYADLTEMPLTNRPLQVDPAELDAQLEELKARMNQVKLTGQ